MKWSLLLILFFAKTLSAQVAASARDLSTLPPAVRPSIRYLSLANLPQNERASAARVMSGHVNALSTEGDIVPLQLIQGVLLRVNLEDYAWKRGTWESLADSDPYFHVKTTTAAQPVGKPWPGGLWEGKHYPAGAFFYRDVGETSKESTITALAPWLSETAEDRVALAYLVTQTQSKAPILRADWFFNHTAAAVDRRPNYYDFLGVKNEKDFQRIIGFDGKLAESFGKEVRESVADSSVTLQPRAILRQNTMGGGYWRTFDFKRAVDKGNPLRVLGKDIEEIYDASEQFGHLPNGLWATGLFDRAGKAQDTAPDFIASDHASRSNDRRVHVNISCLRCHANGGLQDIDGWTRNLLQAPLALQSPDYATAKRLRQQYARKLEPFLERDRGVFLEAVREATGWEAKKYAAEYGAFWERYEDAKVSLEWAARDLGTTPAAFKAALAHYVKQTGSVDTVLSVFLLDGPRQRTITIRQWEELFSTAQLIKKGLVQP